MLINFLALTALGLSVTYLFKSWADWYGDLYMAAGIWIAACLVFAAIYDYRNRSRPEP